jgi:hypothetical protein
MKTLMAAAILGASLMAVHAQDVFVLGGPGSTPVPPIVYQPPVVTGPPVATYYSALPVAPHCATRDYMAPYYSSYYSNPNVIYVGSPGTCGPRYYDYPPCSTPNVIYFGREQAYRHGYNFRHCR